MSTRVIFLGPPGAGKGTQARELARGLGVPHVATGDMLREAAAAGTALGREAKRYMDTGALVPDAVVIGLVDARLDQGDARVGWVLDGFPRTVAQAEALDELLARRGTEIERAVYFEVSREELVRRLTGRRTCRRCAAGYHTVSAPPRVTGRCDRCDGELYQREDDAEATVSRRLDVYATSTAPLLDYYRSRGVLAGVSGEGAVADIAARVRHAAVAVAP